MNIPARAGLATAPLPLRWLEDEKGRALAFSAYPAARPRAHLLISHGFGEHRGWYHHLAEHLCAAGVSVYTFDHYHHGISAGRAGDAPDYAALTAGLALALQEGAIGHLKPGEQVGLLGHSNGGLAVLRLLAAGLPPRAGAVVLSNPLLALPRSLKCWALPLAAALGCVAPALQVPSSPVPARLTGNTAIWPDYGRDTLRFRRVSIRFFKAMWRAAGLARRWPECCGLPLLLLLSAEDAVVDQRATRGWYARLSGGEKRMICYPGLRHELFQEQSWPQVAATVVDWITSRAASPSTRNR